MIDGRDYEMALLSCAFAWNGEEAACQVARLPCDWFYTERGRILHDVVKHCVDHDKPLDLATATHLLRSWKKLGENGKGLFATSDVADLFCALPSAVNYQHYVTVVRNLWRQRKLVETSKAVIEKASQRILQPEELEELEKEFERVAFEGITIDQERREPTKLDQVLRRTLDNLEQVGGSGIKTGFRRLDAMTGGFRPKQLIVIGGRPGSGKSAFALDIAMAARNEGPALIFSLEMGQEESGYRLLAKTAGLDLLKLQTSRSADLNRSKIMNAAASLSDYPLYVDDSALLTPANIRSKIRQLSLRLKERLSLVLVDYLQLLKPDQKQSNREREIAEMSRSCKLIAKSGDIPVVLLSQLNRALETRPLDQRRPQLSDFRESGAIERDADVVIWLYQPFRYTKNDEDKTKAEAIALKQRNGPVGMVPLHWNAQTTTFHDPL
jgi:replicative DNA helicase